MTRLTSQCLAGLAHGLTEYDQDLKAKTGYDLLALAAASAGMSLAQLQEKRGIHKAAVVPVTSGQGVISNFAPTVAALIRHLGVEALVTEGTDVDGIYEGYAKGCSLFFMADDTRYIGWNRLNGMVAENNDKTALGYALVLDKAVGGLAGQEVLVIGLGPVGQHAFAHLQRLGADCVAYDSDPAALAELSCKGALTITSLSEVKSYRLIFEATPSGGWLTVDLLHPQVIVVSPGVPACLDAAALRRHGERFVHDLLEIGTVVMLAGLL